MREGKRDEREGFHEEVDKVTSSEHEVLLESSKVVHEHELVEEDLEESTTGDLVGCVDGSFETGDVAVLEDCSFRGRRVRRRLGDEAGEEREKRDAPRPAFSNFARVAIQSESWQLYRMKFKLFPVEKICTHRKQIDQLSGRTSTSFESETHLPPKLLAHETRQHLLPKQILPLPQLVTLHPSSTPSTSSLPTILESSIVDSREGPRPAELLVCKIGVETNEELRVRVVEFSLEDPALEGVEEGFGDLREQKRGRGECVRKTRRRKRRRSLRDRPLREQHR